MLVTLVRIGNSRGVRLPKAVIEQAGLEEEIDREVKDGKVILSSARKARAGWDAVARACREAEQDELGDWDAALNDFEGAWE